MSSFVGFEEEKVVAPVATTGGKKSIKVGKDKLLKAAAERKVETVMSLPAEAKLSKESPSKVKLAIDGSGHCQVIRASAEKENEAEATPSHSQVPTGEKEDEEASNTKPEHQDRRLINLEEFQTKQKMIEEQNRKRRELLTAAISSRKQQTDKEAQRLDHIQHELAKIDVMLNTDVKFLRDSIEQASINFFEAQKRYDRAESEFVASKMALHSCLERKEMLTDHLCTIIEQNEMRKAKKLEELMGELALCGIDEAVPKDSSRS